MPARKLVLASAVVCMANALKVSDGKVAVYAGTSSTLVTQMTQTNVDVVQGLYDGCTELDDDGAIVSSGPVCVARIISCMLEAVATVSDGSFAAAGATSAGDTFGNFSAQPPGMVRKRDSRAVIASTPGSPMPRRDVASRVVQNIHIADIERSDLHPDDGFAFQTNVHSDNATLFVDHNGTHATARFRQAGNMSSRKRDSYSTGGTQFKFTGVQGIKMEAQGLNAHENNLQYRADLTAFSYGFAYGDGATPPFKEGDVWTLKLCTTTAPRGVFYGRIIAENDPFVTKYETVDPIDCSAASRKL